MLASPRLGITLCVAFALAHADFAVAQGQGGLADGRRLLEQGRYRELVPVAEGLIRDGEASDNKANLAEAVDLWARARVELENEPTAEINAAIERNLSLKEALYGAKSWQYGETLWIRAEVKRVRREATAEADFTASRVACAGQPCESEALRMLARLASAQAQNAKGIELAKEALRLNQERYGELHRSTGLAFAEMAAATQASDPAKALTYADRAVSLLRASAEAEHPYLAYAEGLRGSTGRLVGDYVGARPHFEESLRINQAVYGTSHRLLIATLNNLGLCLKQMGDFRAARTSLERAANLGQAVYGPESPTAATPLGNFGVLLNDMGDHVRAREIFERVLAVEEKTMGPDHPLVGSFLNSLGLAEQVTGDFAAAQRSLERSLAIYEKKDGERSPKTLEVMLSLAGVLAASGQSDAALKLATRAVTLLEQSIGPDNLTTAAARLEKARILVSSRRYGPAEAELALVRAAEEKSGVANMARASAYANSAEAAVRLGQFEAGADFARKSIALFESLLGANAAGSDLPWSLLAEAELGMKRPKEAFQAALASERIRRENQAALAAGLSERNALLNSLQGTRSLDLLTGMAAKEQDQLFARAAFDAVIRNRSMVLDAVATRERTARRNDTPKAIEALAKLTEAREDLAHALERGPNGSDPKQYRAQLTSLQTAREQAELKLAAVSSEYRQRQEQEKAGLEAIRNALPNRTSLVSFWRYADVNGTNQYAAFVLAAAPTGNTADSNPIAIRLGAAADIDAMVAAWRKEISQEMNSAGLGQKANLARMNAAGKALREAVWDPIASRVKGSTRVLLVPDGALQLINFAALPTNGDAYLVESGPLLHTLSTERDVLSGTAGERSNERARPSLAKSGQTSGTDPVGRGMLALGNPAFDAAGTSMNALHRGLAQNCSGLTGLRFEPLPYSAQEVQRVAGIWKRNGTLGEETVLTGTAATKAMLKDSAPGKRVVHLATHGFFLDQACQSDTLLAEDPMLRAGIALAGANRRSGADDGILIASEVAAMDLEGTEWVVLSGCDTGFGQVRAGEGVFGLRRAFQAAGVRTFIGSLWPVEDQETELWMTSLYSAHFGRGMATAESVREAQLQRLRARRARNESTHPLYWAGFLAVGDWR
jgi:CHAT domain-containing protein